MSILSDGDIRKLVASHIVLDPFTEGVQDGDVVSYGLTSAGYDLRLAGKARIFKNTFSERINPKRFRDPAYQLRVFDMVNGLETGNVIVIPPNGYVLAYTLEYIRMPRHLKGHCLGKSTYARCGIIINTTPLEPGWEGHLTLEIANNTPCPSEIIVGEGIAQLEFHTLSRVPEKDYAEKKGKYQFQGGEPTPARTRRE